MQSADTIVAISSAIAPAARIIVRLSGPAAVGVSQSIADHLDRRAGVASTRLRFAQLSIPCTTYVFLSPRSSTGEDVVELHIPGNPQLAKLLLRELIGHGARQADAGEFTARAYFNGKIDLTQAEGIAATISAANDAELRAARQLLAGELSRRVRPMMDSLADALALVEVGIDFVDEDVTFITRNDLSSRLASIDDELRRLTIESRRFERLTHEPTIALVGWPNAGKSTLLNALCGHERAVVSPVAGTTRDVIWAETALRRGIVKIIDAAGIDAEVPADDPSPSAAIARQMRERAMRAVESADIVVFIQDVIDHRPPPNLPCEVDLIVITKIDLEGGGEGESEPMIESNNSTDGSAGDSLSTMNVSAHSGAGIKDLREHLDALAFGRSGGDSLALNQRHLRAIESVRGSIQRAEATLDLGPELIALELREAIDEFGAILGQVTPDDVLGRIFGGFCIGK